MNEQPAICEMSERNNNFLGEEGYCYAVIVIVRMWNFQEVEKSNAQSTFIKMAFLFKIR